MGLFDDKAKLDAIFNQPKKYPPCVVDLTEGEVQAIFNRCLAKDGEGDITYAQVLQTPLAGKNSELIRFSKERIRANSKSISYLFGQLHAVHRRDRSILLEYGIMNYNEVKWTTNADILLKLYELGMVNLNIKAFSLQEDKKSLVTNISTNRPTLSPKDPNFPAWWEAHKGEWED